MARQIARTWLVLLAISTTLAHTRAQTCASEQVVGPGGAAGNNHSQVPRVSADGRFVAFTSYATVFVPGAPPPQVYLFDRATGAFEVISKSTGGAYASYPTPEPPNLSSRHLERRPLRDLREQR
jgi:hypothetical protein